MSPSLEILLHQLNLLENNAIFFRDKKDGEDFKGFSSDICAKLAVIKPTAYYVYNLHPLVLFFDLSEYEDKEREKEIHRQVWSFDYAPIIFIVKNDGIQIFNAFKYDKNQQLLEEVKLSDEERNEKFSFWNLESGFIWNTWFQEQFRTPKNTKHKKRANQQLFENIKNVRETLIDLQYSDFLTEET